MTSPEKHLSFAEVRAKIEEHLRTALGVEKFDITFAKLETPLNQWRVNVEWKKSQQDIFTSTAIFGLDSKTGEVKQFEKDKVWTY